jgi:hypothetical protein
MWKWLTGSENGVSQLSDFPENSFGFVYLIKNLDGHFYIGKKFLHFATKKKIGKKQLAENKLQGIRTKIERSTKESDWLNYWGSEPELLNDIKDQGKLNFERIILKICYSKKELTYWEVYYQFQYNVLHTELSYNRNILGKFYKKDFYKVVS